MRQCHRSAAHVPFTCIPADENTRPFLPHVDQPVGDSSGLGIVVEAEGSDLVRHMANDLAKCLSALRNRDGLRVLLQKGIKLRIHVPAPITSARDAEGIAWEPGLG